MTKQINLSYEHFKISLQGLTFEVKLLDDASHPESWDSKDPVEEFKVIVSNGDKRISYKFYNSIMEKKISDFLKDLGYVQYNNPLFKSWMRRFMWGGYDDVKSRADLTKKRIYYLAYSIINTFAYDRSNDLSSFSEFCSNFGYDEDSRKAEKTYKACVELQGKINSLGLNEEQNKYLEEEAGQETETFSGDVRKAIYKVVKA